MMFYELAMVLVYFVNEQEVQNAKEQENVMGHSFIKYL